MNHGWISLVPPGIRRLFLVLLASLLPASLATAAQPRPQYILEASYLVKFVAYVQWPSGTFASANSPVIIAVLGEDPFGSLLDSNARARGGVRPILVRRVRRVEEAAQCHVVFISLKESDREAAWLAALAGKPILTVGESTESLRRGSVVEFKKEGLDTVTFGVSLPNMEKAGLKISADMLRFAKVKRTTEPGDGR